MQSAADLQLEKKLVYLVCRLLLEKKKAPAENRIGKRNGSVPTSTTQLRLHFIKTQERRSLVGPKKKYCGVRYLSRKKSSPSPGSWLPQKIAISRLRPFSREHGPFSQNDISA
jgi:hypothetical protein